MHKLKLPPYPQGFPADWTSQSENHDGSVTSDDQNKYGHLEIIRSRRTLVKLSPYAKMFYLEWVLNPNSRRYNIAIVDELHGDLNPERLKKAVQRYVQEHFVLHSHIKNINGEIYWTPNNFVTELEYCEHPITDAELLSFVNRQFDLHTDQLCRFKLVKMSQDIHRLAIVFHHLVIDGLSVRNGISIELSHYYNNAGYVTTHNIEEQKEKLTSLTNYFEERLIQNKDRYKSFWHQQLNGIEAIDFAFLKKNNTQSQRECSARHSLTKQLQFKFDELILARLKQLHHQYSISPYYFGLSILAILLHRYTGRTKFAIPFPFGIKKGIDFIYGAQVNTTLMPFQFNAATTALDVFNQIISFVKLSRKGDCNYTEFPAAELFNEDNKHLLQILFNQTNFRTKTFQFENVEQKSLLDKFNIYLTNVLSFDQQEIDSALHYQITYDDQQMDDALVLTFVENFKRIFVEILDDLAVSEPTKPLSKYSLLNEKQYHLVTQEWNKTEHAYPNKMLHELFEEQVAKTPNLTALVYDNQAWTYAQLNKSANQLACYLRNNFNIHPDSVIGLYFPPGYNRIIALWAVLKSGAAYLPIDPALPDERIGYLINDTKAQAIITEQQGADRFNGGNKPGNARIINLDRQQTKDELSIHSSENLQSISQPHHLAYVIYTSGTQGQPKGVLLEHRSVTNYIANIIQTNELSEKSVWAHYVSFSFDFSVLEIYPVLLSGGQLCVIKEEDRMDCNKVNDFYHKHKVTFAFLPTPFAELFYELENTSLKTLMVGGSKLTKHVDTPYKVINAYGPTEATVHATQFTINKTCENIPIGKPLNNVKCYVVDSNLNIAPIGTIGELLIGGEGLARGYLNLPEITEQKFIANPFQTEQEKIENKNGRLYRTGDLVRWLSDGNLEYIGRNDDQIKVRGHRIELSEIEHGLMSYPSIHQAAVIAIDAPGESSEKQISAYYVAQSSIDASKLNEYLSTKLPTYMLPTAYMWLQKMPLLTSGKINKRALPAPSSCQGQDQVYIAPNTLLEKTVCAAYAKILGIEDTQVGINNNFFESGGDSLTAIRLTFLLRKHLKINATDIFKLKTPKKLISELPNAKENFFQRIEQIKLFYQNKMSFALQDIESKSQDIKVLQHYRDYLDQVNHLVPNIDTSKKIRSVLLTGATGFLGCQLLATLLEETTYTIYLPVRAISDATAFDRLNQKFKYYFKVNLESKLDRIRVFAASLGRKNLGLDKEQYETMSTQVDSVIHCASLVKYFGHGEDFEQANIQPTIQLLEFAKLTANKDFHYISTVGVGFDGHVPGSDYTVFTEDDDLESLVYGKHPYIQSKYKAEKLVRQSRSNGITGTIYRVGNLIMNSKTHALQENFEDNMFFAHIKTMVGYKIIPKELAQFEISPVDYTALAFVKIFDKVSLTNQTHHLFNPKIVNLYDVLTPVFGTEKFGDSIEQFIEKVISGIELSDGKVSHPCLYMLYQFWLHYVDEIHTTAIRLSQRRTEQILTNLGFQWPAITTAMFGELTSKIASTQPIE